MNNIFYAASPQLERALRRLNRWRKPNPNNLARDYRKEALKDFEFSFLQRDVNFLS